MWLIVKANALLMEKAVLLWHLVLVIAMVTFNILEHVL